VMVQLLSHNHDNHYYDYQHHHHPPTTTIAMPIISLFAPRRPQNAYNVFDQMRIDACHIYVWQLVISPRDPIIHDRMIFQVQLPNRVSPIWAQLGVVVMCDQDNTVYRLVTHHIDCPPTVLVASNGEALPGLTQLIPACYADPNMSFIYLPTQSAQGRAE
jgi:hypothetical protein